jgi:hypothetical protein
MKKSYLGLTILFAFTGPLAHADFDRTYKAKYADLKERMCGPSAGGTQLVFHDCNGAAVKYTMRFPNSALAAECGSFAQSVSKNMAVGGKKCSSLRIVAPGAGPTEFLGTKCTCTP